LERAPLFGRQSRRSYGRENRDLEGFGRLPGASALQATPSNGWPPLTSISRGHLKRASGRACPPWIGGKTSESGPWKRFSRHPRFTWSSTDFGPDRTPPWSLRGKFASPRPPPSARRRRSVRRPRSPEKSDRDGGGRSFATWYPAASMTRTLRDDQTRSHCAYPSPRPKTTSLPSRHSHDSRSRLERPLEFFHFDVDPAPAKDPRRPFCKTRGCVVPFSKASRAITRPGPNGIAAAPKRNLICGPLALGQATCLALAHPRFLDFSRRFPLVTPARFGCSLGLASRALSSFNSSPNE